MEYLSQHTERYEAGSIPALSAKKHMDKFKKIKLEIELTYDQESMHGDNKEAIKWFFEEILQQDLLILHSNEIGDEIGTVKIIKILN